MPSSYPIVDRLLQEMTLPEKIGQLNLVTSGGHTLTGATVNSGVAEKVKAGRIGSIFGGKSLRGARAFQDIAMQSRLKIPLLFAEDVIHGHRTIFPLPIGLAATWNMPLVEATARIAAEEASAEGLDQVYAPVVDICRDPRWGRMAESPGEDPLLGAAYAEAMVRGYQTDDLTRPDAVMACLKHFAAYGAAQGGRDYAGADLSPMRLHDLYLPPFLAGVRAGAGSIMTGFNSVNGVPMHANRDLIAEVLRARYGFDGVVVSDYTAIEELVAHGVAIDAAEAAWRAIEAGVDLDMVGESYLNTLEEGVRTGRVDPALVDAGCRRVLEAKARLGLFDDPYRRLKGAVETVVVTPERRAVARRAAAEACVLLKNDGDVLPLTRAGRIALVGPLADDRVNMNGTWAVCGRASDAVTIREGLSAASGNATIDFARGCNIVDDPVLADRLNVHDRQDPSASIDPRSPDDLIAEAVSAAEAADVVVAVLGESKEYSGEASSRTDLRLSGGQRRLLAALKGTGKPLVLVLMAGRALVVGEEIAVADAVVYAWFGGTETGNALADILYGTVAPSGRMPVTLPLNEGQIPVSYSEAPTGRPYTGHLQKFRTGYLDLPDGPEHLDGLLPFGYGLTYGSVVYRAFTAERTVLSGASDRLILHCTVENTAPRPLTEVVQFYAGSPVSPISRPMKRLVGFRRVDLEPGETRTVRLDLGVDDLAQSIAETVTDTRKAFPGGVFPVFAGPNARALTRIDVDWQLSETVA